MRAHRRVLHEVRQARRNAIDAMTAFDWLVVGGTVVGVLGIIGVTAALGAAAGAKSTPPTPGTPGTPGVPGGAPVGTLVSIAVTPATVSVMAGASQQFTAIGTYSDGSTLDLTQSVTWSGVGANVSSTGLAMASAIGLAQITATSPNGVQGTAAMNVTATAPPVVPPPAATAYQPTDVILFTSANDTATTLATKSAVAILQAQGGSYAAAAAAATAGGSSIPLFSSYQTFANANGVTPPLRTDGTLDWRTWGEVVSGAVANGSLVGAAGGNTGAAGGSTNIFAAVTDPGMIGLATNAISALPAANAQSLGVSTSDTLSAAVAKIQAKFSSIWTGTGWTSGTLDYASLALLIAAAYS